MKEFRMPRDVPYFLKESGVKLADLWKMALDRGR